MESDAWLGPLDTRLRQQFQFLIEIDRLKTVIRGNRIADGARKENTAEHSWHLALFATTLAEYAIGPISVDRVVQMLLLHDIVEIDAGDTPCSTTPPQTNKPESNKRQLTACSGSCPTTKPKSSDRFGKSSKRQTLPTPNSPKRSIVCNRSCSIMSSVAEPGPTTASMKHENDR